jgi:hypothetical protein
MADFFSGPRDSRLHMDSSVIDAISRICSPSCGCGCEENQHTEQLVVVAVGQQGAIPLESIVASSKSNIAVNQKITVRDSCTGGVTGDSVEKRFSFCPRSSI